LIDHCRRTAGLRCALLRFSPIYGPDSDRPKFIYNFIEKAKRSQTIITHCYKNGPPALDLLHIDDLVSAFIATLKAEFTGTVNIGTGVLTSTREIAEMLRDRIGSSSRIAPAAIEAEVASIAMNWRRAETELNWRPTISLDDGLERLLSEMTSPGDDDER